MVNRWSIPSRCKILENNRCHVDHAGLNLRTPAQSFLDVLGQAIHFQPGRFGPRCMEKGAAGAIDRAGVGPVQVHEVFVVKAGIKIGIRQTGPTAANADDPVAWLRRGPVDHRLDDGVQTGNVAAPCEDSNGFVGHVASPLCRAGRQKDHRRTVEFPG